jgi:hypothetical protein
MWCISDINEEYRKCMYDVLDLYEKPYDPDNPVIGFDEKPKQLLEDKYHPISMKPGKPEKYDSQYVRKGNANIFMAVEYKAGKRRTRVTHRRTKREFAKFSKFLVDKVYPKAVKIHFVLDNLNTHNESAFYETYPKEEAERIINKIKFHYTPKHGSWLNVAEIEIGVLDAQCIKGRISSKNILRKVVTAWQNERNHDEVKIKWTFTKQKADNKLAKYYV